MQICTLVYTAVTWFSHNTHTQRGIGLKLMIQSWIRMGIDPYPATSPSVLLRLRLPSLQSWATQLLAIFLLSAFLSMSTKVNILKTTHEASRQPTKLQWNEWTNIEKWHHLILFVYYHITLLYPFIQPSYLSLDFFFRPANEIFYRNTLDKVLRN